MLVPFLALLSLLFPFLTFFQESLHWENIPENLIMLVKKQGCHPCLHGKYWEGVFANFLGKCCVANVVHFLGFLVQYLVLHPLPHLALGPDQFPCEIAARLLPCHSVYSAFHALGVLPPDPSALPRFPRNRCLVQSSNFRQILQNLFHEIFHHVPTRLLCYNHFPFCYQKNKNSTIVLIKQDTFVLLKH